MTKITTDFVGNETTAVTKSRLTSILAYWGASTAAYTTWGQARTALNALLTSTTAGTIGSTELAGTFLPKINFLNDPDDMIADALFGAGEQGVWLDPSDVANVAWRRNLLLWSEQFNATGVWAAQASGTVTTNTQVAPDGTTTADTLTGSGATLSGVEQAPASIAGPTYTASVYAKAGTSSVLGVLVNGGNHAGWIDLSTGVTTNGGGILSSTSISVGNGWYRVSFTSVITGAFHSGLWLFPTATVSSTTGTGTVHIWGAQSELGSTATEYQRITDLNTEVIARFPNATMYQDAAGTTPVYAPGQPVGLRLDKSKGLVLGAELVANGDFSAGSTGWTGGTVSGGQISIPLFNEATQAISLTAGRTYRVSFDINASAGVGRVTVGATLIDSLNVSKVGAVYYIVTANTTALKLGCISGTSVSFDNVSVKELPGNHATQSTLGSRPMYGIEPKGGRRNLLVQTENFAPIDWTKTSLTVSGNQVSYAGGLGGAKECVQLVTVPGGTASKVLTAYVTVSGSGTFRLKNTHSGVLDNFSANITATSTPQTVTLTVTNGASAGNGLQAIAIINSTGDAAFNLTVHQFQLELGSTATNYQRVTTAFDVTEAGVNTCHYCQYDGSDDGMVTNSIDFTATDKVSVFAGVRKTSDVNAYSMVAELSAASSGNNGTFALMAPYTGATYGFDSKGTLATTAASATTFAAPVNSLLTALGDISGDRATLRVNGTQVAQNTGDQGTGNFGNYKLNIGRRGNDQVTPTFPFNGRDYGIVIVGKLANATAIATTEMWLANKTSGVTL